MDNQEPVIYREVQRPRQVWLWVFIWGFTVFMWYSFIQQIIFGVPIGNQPAPDAVMVILWLVFGIVFPVGMLGFVKLITEVRRDGLYIRFVPFHVHYRSFMLKDLISYKSITYSPLKRFGGWGLRFNLEGETAYNMDGNQGIELKLRKNQTVVVGSRHPEELVKALDKVKAVK